jgi:UDPglucose--hexose-1-phosphate uridylyltransferase
MSDATKRAERRQNLLTGDWILVSPERLARPWQGAAGAQPAASSLSYDPGCYLCPGNLRANGDRNPHYASVFAFDNDFPALVPHAGTVERSADPLFVSETESGICRVLCYSPDHSKGMARMSAAEIRSVVDAWAAQFSELDAREDVGAVTIFENHGQMMGASNSHPHGQIWATRSVPNAFAKEDARQRTYFAAHGEPLLIAYLRREVEEKSRIVCSNDDFVALVPFWAEWPFETLVLPKRAVCCLDRLGDKERDGLADVLHRLTRAYDALFGVPFPYSMGFHQRPSNEKEAPHFVLHAHFYPPLLRSAGIRKFMVGFEMLAMPQRDLTPEDAAERLRAVL